MKYCNDRKLFLRGMKISMASKSIFLILLLVPFFQLSNMVEVQAEEIYQSDFLLENVFLDNENLVPGKESKIWAMMKNMGTERPDDFHTTG